MNIGIYLYDEAEVLDFAGPFEVFSTASRVSRQTPPFNVFLLGEKRKVSARGNFCVETHYTIDRHPELDLVLVAGGVHTEEMHRPPMQEWLKEVSQKATITSSVCTGVFLLAAAGVVTNHRVTTHWEDIPALEKDFPNLTVVREKRWIEDGNIITSGGISAGIDMSLHLVRRLTSEDLALRTARQMEYLWNED